MHGVYIQIGEPDAPAAPAALEEAARLEEALLVVRRASQAALMGQLERARAELSAPPPGTPGFPQALLVHACIALEAGNLPEAAREISSLREALPDSPSPRVLEHLLEVRRQQPALGWRESIEGRTGALLGVAGGSRAGGKGR